MNNQALRAFPVILEFAQHSIFGILQSIVCKRNNSFELIKKATTGLLLLLRRLGSNQRPSGYEPDELPLLYFAVQIYA